MMTTRERYLCKLSTRISLTVAFCLPSLSELNLCNSVSGLVSANRSSPGVDNDFSPSYTTLWIYSIDENTWSPIIEPSRNGGADRWEDYSDDGADSPNTREPRPRLGHTVVFDPGRRAFFAFGGNAGGSSRLNDFWSLSLIRWVHPSGSHVGPVSFCLR